MKISISTIILAIALLIMSFFAGYNHGTCEAPDDERDDERDCVEFSYDVLQDCHAFSERSNDLGPQIKACTEQAKQMYEICDD